MWPFTRIKNDWHAIAYLNAWVNCPLVTSAIWTELTGHKGQALRTNGDHNCPIKVTDRWLLWSGGVQWALLRPQTVSFVATVLCCVEEALGIILWNSGGFEEVIFSAPVFPRSPKRELNWQSDSPPEWLTPIPPKVLPHSQSVLLARHPLPPRQNSLQAANNFGFVVKREMLL